MNKGGQFFIIVAIVFVSTIAGLTAVANYAKVSEERKAFFSKAEELDDETKKLVDYGVHNEQNVDELTKEFLYKYSTQLGGDEFVAIFGNEREGFEALIFEEGRVGGVDLNTGNRREIIIQRRTEKRAEVEVRPDKFLVEIDGVDYEFDKKEGQNLAPVIIREENGERFVASG